MAEGAWPARRLVLAVLGLWLAAAALLVATHGRAIATHAYPDPDDLLRLVEVRDWMGGQAFRDVSQHRMNPPDGAPMHWSRLVDLPIAGIQAALRPAIGAAAAQTAAAVAVPLATLAIVMLAVALAADALAGQTVALVAAAMTGLSPAVQPQLQPLRVDHHGWEIAFSMLALAAILRLRGWRAGGAAGGAIAIGLQISLEQLPFALALGSAIALRFVVDPTAERRAALAWFAGTLAIVEAALFLTLHAPGERGGWCDATTLPHVAALGVVAVGCVLLSRATPATMAGRLGMLAGIAAVAALLFRAIPPHCGLDGFAMLEPIVRDHWLDRVAEGLPIWRSPAATALGLLGVPVMGAIAAAVAIRTTGGERRGLWLVLLGLVVAATLVGVAVMRAMVLANVVAIPALGWAMVAAARRATASGNAAIRVLGGAGAVLFLNPYAPAMVAAAAAPQDADGTASASCLTPAAMAPLDRLPPGRIFTSLDAGPAILFATHHSVLASGHHRNHRAMATEIGTWLGDDAGAERMLRSRGFGYVLLCTPSAEVSRYASDTPGGFAAHMMAGRSPRWLRPIPLPGTPVRLWRLVPPVQAPDGTPSSRSAGGSVPTAAQISRSAVLRPSS